MIDRLRQLTPAPTSMLDVGVGAGTYGDMFRKHFPRAYRAGIEIWKPYVYRFNLPTKYDTLILSDARELNSLMPADIIILGDVIEHMSTKDALMMWNRALEAARRAVYLSIPIIHYPQGPEEGNPYEAHVVDDYSHELVLTIFDGITASWTGSVVGVYEAVTA